MAKLRISNVILIAVSLIIIAIILPIGLTYLGKAGEVNTTIGNVSYLLKDAVDPAILTLLTVLLPILVVIGIIMYFIPKD